ncbi:MAG: hypothetical protein IK025_01240 [Bacteroidales bacterium]|nr:hypothetical protein [Bacteroidales bacterium]
MEDFELLTEDITVTVDEAIDAMEKACKSGDKEAALSAYEIILRDALDETIKRVKAGDYSEETVFTEEQEKRLEDISNDCDCISDEDIQEITDKVESEY